MPFLDKPWNPRREAPPGSSGCRLSVNRERMITPRMVPTKGRQLGHLWRTLRMSSSQTHPRRPNADRCLTQFRGEKLLVPFGLTSTICQAVPLHSKGTGEGGRLLYHIHTHVHLSDEQGSLSVVTKTKDNGASDAEANSHFAKRHPYGQARMTG